jgi:bifunctional DNA-binding transcriptional regulator/antitoxin component of YhaV-PrlF toxin-antitoxin module
MTLVRVRGRGEITLPRELQEALAIREGDTLEAERSRAASCSSQ